MQLTFDDMMTLCDSKPELRAKEEIVNGKTVTIFSYMVSMTDTFDSALAQEFRGTTFCNDTKECICRPFPKFFNVGEKESTQLHCVDWTKAEFFTKHDGSMLTPLYVDDKLVWKSKNTFYSDVAIEAGMFYNRVIATDPDRFPKMTKEVLLDYTPIFEYVGPNNQIVLSYEAEDLILLGWRNIKKGGFVHAPNLRVLDVSYHDILNMEEIEGFVIWDGTQLVKAKTEWYMERHKITSEFNVKAIITATLDNTVDDMIATIAQLGMTLRMFQVQQLRDEVVREKIDVGLMIDMYYDMTVDSGSADRKEYALYINATVPKQYRSSMFKLLDNKPIDNIIDKLVFETIRLRYKKTIASEEEAN